ncbi:helix-turn-helix domain-containing protein [Clostridium sp. CMCC3677]|uniref:helix-turn-helix domain-containing protein n=1 Tax=Clostridium sp. CMCC3677 TaxID=2949963 RepID=UPI0013F0BF73|nr:helix-turn-helix domain-containing protein [Clostridium sp. CMCC3677]NFG62392.1 helix-turn-helix domain-containing protein [Clostridium botulinum]NFO15475.1 helix-turn-helix domain-containing protein [Clostridium botulinum]NFQ10247.1 helix-turn-helix domain-containing protein [Clostridium botulinum]
MGIGYKLKELRRNKKLTQKQLADSVGLSEMSIRRYENDVNEPTIDILRKIADKLETPLNDIIATDPNSKLYKATSGINTLKEEAEKEAKLFEESLKIDIAFITLCKYCGFKIDIETDEDNPDYNDTHIISYKDKDNNTRQFKISSEQYNHLFKEACSAITKEVLFSQNYDFLGY